MHPQAGEAAVLQFCTCKLIGGGVRLLKSDQGLKLQSWIRPSREEFAELEPFYGCPLLTPRPGQKKGMFRPRKGRGTISPCE